MPALSPRYRHLSPPSPRAGRASPTAPQRRRRRRPGSLWSAGGERQAAASPSHSPAPGSPPPAAEGHLCAAVPCRAVPLQGYRATQAAAEAGQPAGKPAACSGDIGRRRRRRRRLARRRRRGAGAPVPAAGGSRHSPSLWLWLWRRRGGRAGLRVHKRPALGLLPLPPRWRLRATHSGLPAATRTQAAAESAPPGGPPLPPAR